SRSLLSSCASYIILPSFFLTHPAPTDFSPLSLHDALPICWLGLKPVIDDARLDALYVNFLSGWELDLDTMRLLRGYFEVELPARSEEHTSELPSLTKIVCRLLL